MSKNYIDDLQARVIECRRNIPQKVVLSDNKKRFNEFLQVLDQPLEVSSTFLPVIKEVERTLSASSVLNSAEIQDSDTELKALHARMDEILRFKQLMESPKR